MSEEHDTLVKLLRKRAFMIEKHKINPTTTCKLDTILERNRKHKQELSKLNDEIDKAMTE